MSTPQSSLEATDHNLRTDILLRHRVANEEVQRATQQAAQAARASATERDPARAYEQASEAAQKLREAGLAAAEQAKRAAAGAIEQVPTVRRNDLSALFAERST